MLSMCVVWLFKFGFAVFLIVGACHYAVWFVVDLLLGLFVSVCTLSITVWLGLDG